MDTFGTRHFLERLSSLRRLKCTAVIEKETSKIYREVFQLCPLFSWSLLLSEVLP